MRLIAKQTTDQQWHTYRARLVNQKKREKKAGTRKLGSILSISPIDHRHCIRYFQKKKSSHQHLSLLIDKNAYGIYIHIIVVFDHYLNAKQERKIR
jgi:hypothetical protein